MYNLHYYFENVHPRKRVERTPLYDWAGRPMPKTLDEVYGRYSSKKAYAYRFWRGVCEKLHGERFCITSHTCNFFSISFDFPHPDTGEMMRAIATGRSSHCYYINPEL